MGTSCLCPGEGAVDWVRVFPLPHRPTHKFESIFCFSPSHKKTKVSLREKPFSPPSPYTTPLLALIPSTRNRIIRQIRLVFKDCVYTAADEVGFYFGLASIACWLVAQVPQFVQNFRLKSAEGLSPWFLAEWLMVGRQQSYRELI